MKILLHNIRKVWAWILCRSLILSGLGMVVLVSCDSKSDQSQAALKKEKNIDVLLSRQDSAMIIEVEKIAVQKVEKPLVPDYNPAPIQPTGYGAMPAYELELPEKN